MKTSKKLYCFLFIMLSCILHHTSTAEYHVHAAVQDTIPIPPAQYQKLLGKGMDVDWSKTGAGKRNYSEVAVKNFKKAGIQHVRIRVKDPVSESMFRILDKQISDCIKHHMAPVLAYQADEFKNTISDHSMAEAVEWWRAVAEHYKDYSYLLSFDMLIECSDALNKQPLKLNEYYEKTVCAIRSTNPQRIIMMSPRVRSDAAYLDDLAIPTQANGFLMAEWHFYASGPSKTNPRKLWTTGTKEEKKLIKNKINLALTWQEKTGIPTWVGAWMAGNYNDTDDYSIAEQVEFANYMVSQLEMAQIPFAVNSDTKFYDRETDQWLSHMLPLRYCIFSSYDKAVCTLFKGQRCHITSAKKISKNSIQLKWDGLKKASGYIITISPSSKFLQTKKYAVVPTQKTIKKLHAKTAYDINIKGYLISNGKKIYSKESKTICIKL